MKKHSFIFAIVALFWAAMACDQEESTRIPPENKPASNTPTVESESRTSIFDQDGTAFGFFPSPPEATHDAVLNHFQALGDHADFILIQPNVPWEAFVQGVDLESRSAEDLRNQIILARQNYLEWIFVVDPLNGLNRREFFGLPDNWEANFANPDIRSAFINFTMWIVDEFEPRYLGLASEINTYMDAHPEDVDNYLSLYFEVYGRVKAVAPNTQVFVTFQWDDLNNMFEGASEGRPRYQVNWDQIESFEPLLDLWVISSYPYFAFPNGEDIPDDYYRPLLEMTDKPLAVAEGGYSTQPIGPVSGSPEGQVGYLEAIHDQLGNRLSFWVYIILNDLNMESIAVAMEEMARPQQDIDTLGMFAYVGLRESDGEPKPALELWDRYRLGE